MGAMFAGAESFNQDLSKWNIEKCKNMYGMFYGAKKFNIDSVKNWDLSVKNTDSMFNGGENGEEAMEEYKNKRTQLLKTTRDVFRDLTSSDVATLTIKTFLRKL
ncbi:hypothetical protein TrLO_g2134 [Triparma laevis f. longispina]|uniref:Uncharacterized protein n=1 Tax=Triparma laevis f. longispina TaxID=1714387 RepID=A0A9W7KYQ9_9STRA|nr:hypothetical protein TrLO_g2134 [Triparma laevis f. longispina]